MDNLCHTLAGAAFAQAGLKRRTRFATATLLIGANLPDIDVLVFATSEPAVAFRRGWTHGVVAQALLPVALTAAIVIVARLRRDHGVSPPLNVRWLLALSYIALFSHVALDLLNNYGVRLLAPVNWRWFYGDAVFIIDPWLWLTLGGGVWLSARGIRDPGSRTWTTPARTALVIATLYIAGMCLHARLARGFVLDAWRGERGVEPLQLMVGPVPLTPFRRTVIVDAGDHYETGTFTTLPLRVTFDPETVEKNADDPRVAQAREAPHIRAFLVWSRFPVWTLQSTRGGTLVSVGDMRFAGRGGFVQRVVVPETAGIISHVR
jgi:inner membrane protein